MRRTVRRVLSAQQPRKKSADVIPALREGSHETLLSRALRRIDDTCAGHDAAIMIGGFSCQISRFIFSPEADGLM